MADHISVSEGSGKSVATDDVGGNQYQLIKPAFGVDGAATLVSSSDPLPVTATVSSITGSVAVHFDASNPSVNVGTPTIAGITASVGVFFSGSNPSVTIAGQASTFNVQLDPGHTLGAISTVGTVTTLTGITNTVHVDFQGSNPSVQANPIVGQTGVAAGSGITGVTTQRVVQVTDVASSVQLVAGSAIAGIVGLQTTASLFTVSGSASTLGNNTLIAPSANASFKVFAYSIQTTGAVSIAARFTTGAATGATELWRPLVTASGVTGVQGANLASHPAAPIFVTGVSTTLSLWLDSATLTHYSIGYTKESA